MMQSDHEISSLLQENNDDNNNDGASSTGRSHLNVALSQSPSSPLNSHQQRTKKSYLTFHNLIYVCGVYILFSKIKSRCTPPKSFVLDDYPDPPPQDPGPIISYRIPKIIHQSYKSFDTLPQDWADTPSRWKELHPTYEYKFWSDDDNRKLIQEYYPWFLDTYDGYPAPIQRADAARYFVVLHYGGIYADMDILPIKNVDSILYKFNLPENEDKQMLVAETYNLGLTNALFASIPNSTVLHDFVKELPSHTKPLHGFEYFIPHFAVLLSTGPTRLWIYLNQHRESILTLNPAGWGQCHQCKQHSEQCTPQDGSFFETRKGGSWHKWDTRIMNFIFCHVHFCVWGGICCFIWLHSNINACMVKKKNTNNINKDAVDQREKNGKIRKKWNTTMNAENAIFILRMILSQYRLPVFCGVILLLVL